MSPVALHCSNCRKVFKLVRNADGFTVRCTTCGELLRRAVSGEAKKRPPDPVLKGVIAGCRPRKRLSAGRTSVTYVAHHSKLGIQVALELFPHDRPGYDYQKVSYLLSQLSAASRVRHPNVAGVLDLGRRSDSEFVVRELVDGGSVRGLLDRRGSLTPGDALPIAEEVLRGLAAAHELGLTHGRISPDTMLLDYDGSVKLADLGRPLEPQDLVELTPTGRWVLTGPCFYVAPERVGGEPGDIRSDLYSLGASLYEMLSGRVPFDGADVDELLQRRLEGPPEELHLVAPEVPPDLCEYVARLMSPQPADRPADPAQALSELKAVALLLSEDKKIKKVAAAVTPTERARARRRNTAVWVLAAVALLAFASWPISRFFRGAAKVAPTVHGNRVLILVTPATPEAQQLNELQRGSLLALAELHVSCCGTLAVVNPFASEEMLRAGKGIDDILLTVDPDYVLRMVHSPGLERTRWNLSLSNLRGKGWTVATETATEVSRDDPAVQLNEALGSLLGMAAQRLGDELSGPVRYDPDVEGWADAGLWEGMAEAISAEREGLWPEARLAVGEALARGAYPGMPAVLDAFYEMAESWHDSGRVATPRTVATEWLRGEFAHLGTVLAAMAAGDADDVNSALGAYVTAFPDAARGHYLLGLWRVRIGAARDEAVAAFWRAVEADPGYLPAAQAVADLTPSAQLPNLIGRYRGQGPGAEKVTRLEQYCSLRGEAGTR